MAIGNTDRNVKQGHSKLDNWGGGGADIHRNVLTNHKNNRFQKRLIPHCDTNI